MLDEYKVAEVVLNKIDEKGPVNIDWNNKGWWIRIIVLALREAGIGKKATKNTKPQERQLPGNQSNN
ncbi:hypothetical protein AALB39_26190 [Lachnospiraceae bacterium 54-53]